MEIGIDSFASILTGNSKGLEQDSSTAMARLLDRIGHADQCGLDVFGLGEHHRREFLDSSTATILAAAATRTRNIRLTSAVTVLSAADPVRVFQSFATLDLISQGRAEMVVGRGSSIEAFPLFGFDLRDYDELFIEKLDLLLKIRDEEKITWTGKFRAPMNNLAVYPRPVQTPLPIWLGVGGTPASFVRAGTLGLPLMVAIIGGNTHRFRPLVDLYREAGEKAGHAPETLKVGLHSLGYVADDFEQSIKDYYPGYSASMTKLGAERGWPPMTEERFNGNVGPMGSLLLGSPQVVAEKIIRHGEALGGISRVTFQMDNAGLSHAKLMRSIELIGGEVSAMINA